ncbi:MAG: MFS transporter [Gemmatimonadota bacterium]
MKDVDRTNRAGLPRAVLALSAVSFFTDVSSEMIYPLIPVFLAGTLGASARLVGIIEGTAEAVAAILRYYSGRWSDRLASRKPLVVIGYGISSLARPLMGVAQSGLQVLAIRVSDRIGKGIRSSPRDALIADVTDESRRGRAFGFHRGADHAGALVGPLVAFALLTWLGFTVRGVFLAAAVPAALAMVVLVLGLRETPRQPARPVASAGQPGPEGQTGSAFTRYLIALAIFTLGNSTDAFLLLRAGELGVAASLLPLLWSLLHLVKASTAPLGGIVSDHVGRKPLIVGGWLVYGVVYLGFGVASEAWHVWALFALYGTYFGLTEGVEKALVADMVPAAVRGRAFGLYNMTIGLAVLPAALIFGAIWDATDARTAFTFGAAMAVVAGIILSTVSATPTAAAVTGPR